MKKILVTLFGIMLLSWSSLSIADYSCNLLTEGNKHYSSSRYQSALNIYMKIEESNEKECAGAVYATIATIYTIFGNRVSGKNKFKLAMLHYKTASIYNRKFANAVRSSCR